jgi:erythromycin esterase
VDAPYDDATFGFLRPLVGNAHVLAIGEVVHGGHEPLAFRNEVIRYAVTHLGFTAVAIESGFTEAGIIDDYIQGGPGNVDSVVRAGITWEFERLPENHDLVVWLHSYNANATKKAHFYGLDLTGSNDTGFMPGAAHAITAPLSYLDHVAPPVAARFRQRFEPFLDRWIPTRFAELSTADRDLLRAELDSLSRAFETDSARYIRATSHLAYARARRNVWMAIRLHQIMTMDLTAPPNSYRGAIVYRDSMMAENTQWVRLQSGLGARIIVFAHNGHVLDSRPVYGGERMTPLGHYLRGHFGPDLVVLGATAGTVVGGTGGVGGWLGDSGESRADPTTFSATLAKVGLPTFVLDRRSGDGIPDVAAALAQTWPFMLGSDELQPVVPHEAFDAVVYFERITSSKFR